MPRHVAFLRAINVGGRTVRMDQLRGLFEALGFQRVWTFIASGNVVFDAPARGGRTLEERIEAHLRRALGYDVAAFLRSPAEIATVAAFRPFPEADRGLPAASLQVMFLQAPLPARARQALAALRTEVDEFHARGREVYWLSRGTVSKTMVDAALLGRTIGMPVTVRNVTTVRRLAARLHGSEEQGARS